MWTVVIRIADYPDRLGPSGKRFLTVIILHLFYVLIFPQLSNIYKELCINPYPANVEIFYLYVNK